MKAPRPAFANESKSGASCRESVFGLSFTALPGQCDIRGRVLNSSDGVVIEAEGSETGLEPLSLDSENRTPASGPHRPA